MSPFSHGVVFLAATACFSLIVSGSERESRRHTKLVGSNKSQDTANEYMHPVTSITTNHHSSGDEQVVPVDSVNTPHILLVNSVTEQPAHLVNPVDSQHAHPEPIDPGNNEDMHFVLPVRSAQSSYHGRRKTQNTVGSLLTSAIISQNSDLPYTRKIVSKRKAGKQKAKTGRKQKMGHTDTLPTLLQSDSRAGYLKEQSVSVDRQILASASSELSAKLSQQQHEEVVKDSRRSAAAMASEDVGVVKPTVYRGLDGTVVNMTQFLSFLSQQDFRRQLNREAQWAYMCLVVVICGMMWTMWYLGGLERCRHHSNTTSDSHDQHLMDVHEVLKKQQHYLPMFTEPEWEEVLMCDRATDP